MVNGKYETLGEGATNLSFCVPETFWLFQLRGRDILTLRWSDVIYETKQTNRPSELFQPCKKFKTARPMVFVGRFVISKLLIMNNKLNSWVFNFNMVTHIFKILFLMSTSFSTMRSSNCWTLKSLRRNAVLHSGHAAEGLVKSVSTHPSHLKYVK